MAGVGMTSTTPEDEDTLLGKIGRGVSGAIDAYRGAEQDLARNIWPINQVMPIPQVRGKSLLETPPAEAQPTTSQQPPAAGVDVTTMPIPANAGGGAPVGPAYAQTSVSGGSRTREVATAAEKEQLKKLDAAQDQTEAVLERRKQVAMEAADAEAQLAASKKESTLALQEEEKVRRQQIETMYGEGIKALGQRYDQVLKESQKDYWADKSDGAKVLAALAVGLGQFAAVRSGTSNTALHIVENTMDRDAQKKRELFQAELTRQGFDRADLAKKMEFRDIELKAERAAMYERLENERAAVMTKFGRTKEEIEGDMMIGALRERRAALRLDYEKGLRDKVTSTWQRTVEPMAGANKPLEREAREKAEGATNDANQLESLGRLVEANPAAWREVQEHMREHKKQEAREKTTLGRGLNVVGQSIGAVPVSLDDRMKNASPIAKQIATQLLYVQKAGARIIDPEGAINQASLDAADAKLNTLGATPKQFAATVRDFSTTAKRKAEALIGGSAWRPPSAGAISRGVQDLKPYELAALQKAAKEFPNTEEGKQARQVLEAWAATRRRN